MKKLFLLFFMCFSISVNAQTFFVDSVYVCSDFETLEYVSITPHIENRIINIKLSESLQTISLGNSSGFVKLIYFSENLWCIRYFVSKYGAFLGEDLWYLAFTNEAYQLAKPEIRSNQGTMFLVHR